MSANETQVGGTHYKAQYQHWDLVADLRLNYFEGQITKYVSRAAKKNGKQDVEKALHFAEKMYEVYTKGRLAVRDRQRGAFIGDRVALFASENGLTTLELAVVHACCTWQGASHLRDMERMIKELLDAYTPLKEFVPSVAAEPLGGADGSYVNQDQTPTSRLGWKEGT